MSKLEDIDPTVVNDDGTGRTGTRVDKAWKDAFVVALDSLIHSNTNTAVAPNAIIDEVIASRGSLANLNAFHDVEHNEDGTHKNTGLIATHVTESQLMGGLGNVNVARNDDFLVWPAGDTSAPLYWPLTGAAATIARTGTGLGDTSRKVGDFAVKLTRVGTDCYLENALLAGAAFTRANFLRSKWVALGMWVKCSTPNIARIQIDDGIGTSQSAYHTGGGAFEFLSITRQLDSSATRIGIRARVDTSNGNAVFSGAGAMLLDSDMDAVQFAPCPMAYAFKHFVLGGTVETGTNLGRVVLARGSIVKDVQMLIKTAPTDAALKIDINSYDGASYTSMFSTVPEIAASAFVGGAQPDGTYARRCLRGEFGTSRVAGGELSLDVDQVGSTIPGSDLAIEVRSLVYNTPFEKFLNHDDG